MKIYLDQLPSRLMPDEGQWGFVTSLIDRVLLAASYLAAVGLFAMPFGRNDLIVVLIVLMVSAPAGRAPFRRMSGEIAWQLVKHWGLALLSVLLVAGALGLVFPGEPPLVEGSAVLGWAGLSLFALFGAHAFSPSVAPYLGRHLYKQDGVLIVGINDVALRLSRLITSGEAEGQRLVGYVEDRSLERVARTASERVLGGFSDIGELTRTHGINVIYLTIPMTRQPRVLALLEQLQDTTASVFFVPDVFVARMIQGRVATVAGLPMLSVCDTPLQGSAAGMKRALDLVVTIALLPFLLPVMAVIALAVKATSPGPAIFKQRRFGLDGREISVLKFRTMRVMEDGDTTYTQVTREDPRVTPLGRSLRRTSLDELPQILNVLAGSMSLVGPRPHAIAVNEQYRKLITGYMLRHKVKPGITGWAQVHGARGGNDLSSMRKRTEYDIAYLQSWSLSLDIRILWRTAVMLVRGDMMAY
ncbi:undecaprenyl-phosphate glucose phosphotransferase [Ramlibacter algicola]|uniref:Undecaprenyl-phosphate glucose phosphotransferase n=1 Tax=Ramlibacter algicola TaxID=2795217 RepID=A0A934PYX7_9BURK|nr:undecaprenyl-phosphate glucose phosphotransferase [Ramlibacter algicola]MBK0391668.1 undecaprenyl-phosphate glucose phosphotransferase [Ramlibacter algicola]